MQLISFSVSNFRSINESGPVKVTDLTALLGRNESGKSNLLLALRSLNPPEGFQALNPIKDFPRHRKLSECSNATPVLSTTWNLDESEKAELAKIWPRAKGVSQVRIGRRYGDRRWVTFVKVKDETYDAASLKQTVRKTASATRAAAKKLSEDAGTELLQAADAFEKAAAPGANALFWAKAAKKACEELETALSGADAELSQTQEGHLNELIETSERIAGDESQHASARDWAIENLPVFVFLEDYPELDGRQNIAQFLQRQKDPNQVTDADRNFEKMCKVAGLNPEELHELHTNKDSETRNQLANRASAVLTTEIRRLWKDRPLKVRFNPDGEHMETLISDPNAVYDVEVNLNERSRGFRWFFSFYVTFSADTKEGDKKNAVLLLDEPGLYLHARSQRDLLQHFREDFDNQIVYTTHSPFMVPTNNLDSIRTVNISEKTGTTVANDPSGDERTLFPLQAALGYDVSQSLFIDQNCLVVEGVTDYWFLSSTSSHLKESGGTGLDDAVTITPGGGAQKIPYMVALLASQELNVLVLFDEEPDARGTKDDLIKSRLIRERNVAFVSEAFEDDEPKEADIEDLLPEGLYQALVLESYAKELAGKTPNFNENIPRVARRCELALDELDIEFFKTRPARLFLDKIANNAETILDDASKKRFEKLFMAINERYSREAERGAKPFK